MEPSEKSLQETRKNSLIETIKQSHVPARKDSVAPLALVASEHPGQSASDPVSPDGSGDPDRTRRLSRRLSLRPPTNVYKYDGIVFIFLHVTYHK